MWRSDTEFLSAKLSSVNVRNRFSRFMGEVTDHELIEILVRLPDARAAIQCSVVSKRWHSLITNPYFRTRFTESYRDRKGVDICILFKCTDKSYDVPLYKLPSDYNSSSEPFELSFMPDPGDLEIKASCGDLLLIWRGGTVLSSARQYYISNSVTKQWFALPEIPYVDDYAERCPTSFCLCGSYGYSLVLDPNDQSRYMALVIFKSRFLLRCFMFKAAIFDSATQQWTINIWKMPYVFPETEAGAAHPLEVVGLTNNRMLHWVDGWFEQLSCVVAFDPFSSNFRLIPLPSPNLFSGISTPYSKEKVRLGVVSGRLRISLMSKTNELSFSLRIWELENDDSWRLVHDVIVDTWGVAVDGMMLFSMLTFDPSDGNVIFFLRDKEIYRYDIDQDVHYKVCEFPIQCFGNSDELYVEIWKLRRKLMFVLSTVLPVWPTSIASLQHHHN